MSSRLVVFLNSGDESLPEKCRSLSDRIEIITREDLKRDESLLGRVEIIYGGFSPERWSEAPRLRWVQATGAGVERFLIPAVRDSDVVLTNVSGIHAAPITEHMFGMLLAYNRRLFQARDLQRESKWGGEGLSDGLPLLEGRTLGLLGVGAIGTFSARVGRAFGMRVLGLRRSSDAHPDLDETFQPDRLLDMLSQSDVIMNTLPLTNETRGILGAREFTAMRNGAILINTGRGATIRTDDLVSALETGRPGAALLDVTDPEPLPTDHPLWQMPNVVITPHYSGSHADYALRCEPIFLENLRRYLAGEPLKNVVDKQAGY